MSHKPKIVRERPQPRKQSSWSTAVGDLISARNKKESDQALKRLLTKFSNAVKKTVYRWKPSGKQVGAIACLGGLATVLILLPFSQVSQETTTPPAKAADSCSSCRESYEKGYGCLTDLEEHTTKRLRNGEPTLYKLLSFLPK